MLSSKDVENVVLEMQEIASETILNHISRFKTARTVNEQKKVIESFENIFRTNLKNSQSLVSEPPRLVFKRRFVPFAVWYLININDTATADEIISYAQNNDLIRKEWKYKSHMPNRLARYMSQSLLFEKCGRTKEKNSRNIWRLKK